MEDYFSKFKSQTPSKRNIGSVKNHPVRLAKWEETDSFTAFDGTEKDETPGYSDPTPQIVCIFVSLQGQGGIIERFHGCGYYRYSELSEKQIKSGNVYDINGYACVRKGDEFVRIEDPQRTKACVSILSQMFHAFGLPPGSGINDLDRVIAEGRSALVTIQEEVYEGRKRMRVKGFKRDPHRIVTSN